MTKMLNLRVALNTYMLCNLKRKQCNLVIFKGTRYPTIQPPKSGHLSEPQEKPLTLKSIKPETPKSQPRNRKPTTLPQNARRKKSPNPGTRQYLRSPIFLYQSESKKLKRLNYYNQREIRELIVEFQVNMREVEFE